MTPERALWAWLLTLQEVQYPDDVDDPGGCSIVSWHVLAAGVARHLARTGELASPSEELTESTIRALVAWGVLWSAAVGRYVVYKPASRLFLFEGERLDAKQSEEALAALATRIVQELAEDWPE